MATTPDLQPVYFSSPGEMRAWLEGHHETERELIVGYYKKATGRPTLTWPESVDEALCFGWIDGVRRRVDVEEQPPSYHKAVNHWIVSAQKPETRAKRLARQPLT